MDNELKGVYSVMSTNGLEVEKSDGFNNSINGQVNNIVHKSRRILDSELLNTIEIFFENKTILIKDSLTDDLNVIMIVNTEKK